MLRVDTWSCNSSTGWHSISDIAGMRSAQNPKDRQYPPYSQPLRPTAVWQVIQKYPLPYHKTWVSFLNLLWRILVPNSTPYHRAWFFFLVIFSSLWFFFFPWASNEKWNRINYVCKEMRGKMKEGENEEAWLGDNGFFAHIMLDIGKDIWHECQVHSR